LDTIALFGNVVIASVYVYIAFFEEVSLAYAVNVCVLCWYFLAVNNGVGQRARRLQNISGV
jgi:hypothetical protein